jgi:hypothetical protein
MDPVSGRNYFANRSTGETSWVPPSFFPPLAPSPPTIQPPPPPLLNEHYRQIPTHPQHPQTIYPSAQSVVPQQVTQLSMYDLQGTNGMPILGAAQQPNYSQLYPSNQPQMPDMALSNVPNDNMSTQQQIEPMSTINNNTPPSGLGPSTAVSLGMLVPSVRAMIDAENTQRVTQQVLYIPPRLELEGLTAGAIADLCCVSRDLKARNVDGGDFAGGGRIGKREEGNDDEVDQCYTPLQPFLLPVSSVPPHIEQGRVDIRLHSLHRELGKI